MKFLPAPSIAAILILAGCVPSLHELASEQQGVIKRELEGTWRRVFPDPGASQSDGRWKFVPDEDHNVYRLSYIDGYGHSGEFSARLTKIGSDFYLDMFPVKPHKLSEAKPDDLSSFYFQHLLPVHTFVRITQWEPTLNLSFFDARKFDQYLKDHPDALPHERTDVSGELVLTASTDELRAFFASFEGDPPLFSVPITLERQ